MSNILLYGIRRSLLHTTWQTVLAVIESNNRCVPKFSSFVFCRNFYSEKSHYSKVSWLPNDEIDTVKPSSNLQEHEIEENLPRKIAQKPKKLHSRKIKNLDDNSYGSNFAITESVLPDDLFGSIKNDPEEILRKKSVEKLRHDTEWTNQFGSLAEDAPEFKDLEIDRKQYFDDIGEEDSFEKPYQRLSSTHRKNTPVWYGNEIKRLAKQRKIYECIDLLETKMLKEDRVKPNQYVFTVLIGVLGRAGYTRKAFKIFSKMKKFGLEPEDPTYTALFNACANCPWPQNGLKEAVMLRQRMTEISYTPNKTTFKAMIKAFGRCGDLQTAFALVDEMVTHSYSIDEEVIAMLLQACVTDKETGLRFAIETWRRMNRLKLKHKVKPTIYHYNLLVRAISECQLGDPVLTNQLLSSRSHDQQASNQLPPETVSCTSNENIPIDKHNSKPSLGRNPDNISSHLGEDILSSYSLQVDSGVKSKRALMPYDEMSGLQSHTQDGSLHHSISILDAIVPDILAYKGNYTNVMGLTSLKTPQDRFALFGGLPKLLMNMHEDKVTPDIKTFTQLISVIPEHCEAETDLLSVMKASKVKPDVDFFNLIIKRRNMRHDFTGAQDVISLIASYELEPNIMTFGCLALGCRTKASALQLIKDIEVSGVSLSVVICNTLLYQSNMNFNYKLELLKIMLDRGIRPDQLTLKRIEQQIKTGQNLIIAKEKGKPVPRWLLDNFSTQYEDFRKYYKKWLLSMELEPSEIGPWEQFKKPTPIND